MKAHKSCDVTANQNKTHLRSKLSAIDYSLTLLRLFLVQQFLNAFQLITILFLHSCSLSLLPPYPSQRKIDNFLSTGSAAPFQKHIQRHHWTDLCLQTFCKDMSVRGANTKNAIDLLVKKSLNSIFQEKFFHTKSSHVLP